MGRTGIIPTRAVIGIMMFMACLVSYSLRANMSLNILKMVETTASKGGNKSVSECLVQQAVNVSEVEPEKFTAEDDEFGPKYAWSSKTQGYIISAYYYGYVPASLPGGFFAEKFGPRQVLGITTLCSAVLTMLTPLVATLHYGYVIAIRVLIGVFGGVGYPALHSLIAKWSPPAEKGKFIGTLMGGTLGMVLTWPLCGIILETMAWSWAFVIPGGIAFLWSLLWFALVTDTPESHPRISDEEKDYIIKSLGGAVTHTKRVAPYAAICASIPFWGLAAAHFGNLWGLYLLLNSGPKYMSEVLGFSVAKSGFLAALPYLARLFMGFFFGFVGDKIRASGKLSVTSIRKSFLLFSHVIPGILLVGPTLTGCDPIAAVIFLTCALGFNGASTITNLQNSQDLSPNFAGTIYGMINFLGGVTGFITPMVTGYVTEYNNGLAEWQIIFWLGASIYIGSAVIFYFIGSGERQPWNGVEEEKAPEGIVNVAYDHDHKTERTKV